MIQDIAPHHLDQLWRCCRPRAEDSVYIFHGRDVLLNGDGELPRYRQLPEEIGAEYRYLFQMEETHYFLLWREEPLSLPGFSYRPGRDFRGLRPMEQALAGFTALHLNGWYRSNRFCGRCGSAMHPAADERKMVCPRCGNQVYPRLNPAVIAAVTDGERLLMTRYSPKSGHRVHHYVLVAGFVEIGETAEQTVAREVLEETGVRVNHVRYFGSQPWGVDGNLTLGYVAELAGGDAIQVDGQELSDARWFRRAEVPVPADDTSITSEMIRAFAEGRI